MPKLDRVVAKRIVAQLAGLDGDMKPLWGSMSVAQMQGHLLSVVKYTTGAGQEMPFKGNWKTRHIFRPIILNGIKEIPHNIRLPKTKDGEVLPQVEATVETLEAAITQYLDALEGDGLGMRTHPFFGPLTAQEWQKFHHAHFMHHMKQFGCWA